MNKGDKKLLSQAFDRLHREVESNRELFLKLKKEYDHKTIHENLFFKGGPGFKEARQRLKSLAETLFGGLFPRQKRDDEALVYKPEFQKVLDERFELCDDDATVHLLQLSYI